LKIVTRVANFFF